MMVNLSTNFLIYIIIIQSQQKRL